MTTWRYIKNDNVTASSGLAADEVLANCSGARTSLPTLRLYTYQPCALVGRFQTIENELNLNYCVENNIPVNRRPTGGGAIIMGQDQLGVALVIPGKSDETYAHVRKRMAQFSQGIISGLATLGIEVEFRRKNDLEVNGKKIAGLGLHKTATNGLLFHASLLVDLDVPFMLNVLKTPFEKISDKEISTVSERTTTVLREINTNLNINELRTIILNGYRNAFQMDIQEGDFMKSELEEIHQLEKDKYRDSKWIFQTTDVLDATGKDIVKTRGGLLDVRIVLAGKMIKSAYIGGDFFTSEHAIADLEQSLRWHSSNENSVSETLSKIYNRWSEDLTNLPVDSLIKAINSAIQKAAGTARKASADPYGCFVTPGGTHA
ncbi:MAG: lipoate protein ligase C-terminal domain-containing protein [Candidatus Marinimicrobia bacterium]|nr:lipoate protein ligase C-terminal domain-containing protein [Candidatus Neomarinimicrobiota bacterium]